MKDGVQARGEGFDAAVEAQGEATVTCDIARPALVISWGGTHAYFKRFGGGRYNGPDKTLELSGYEIRLAQRPERAASSFLCASTTARSFACWRW